MVGNLKMSSRSLVLMYLYSESGLFTIDVHFEDAEGVHELKLSSSATRPNTSLDHFFR